MTEDAQSPRFGAYYLEHVILDEVGGKLVEVACERVAFKDVRESDLFGPLFRAVRAAGGAATAWPDKRDALCYLLEKPRLVADGHEGLTCNVEPAWLIPTDGVYHRRPEAYMVVTLMQDLRGKQLRARDEQVEREAAVLAAQAEPFVPAVDHDTVVF